MREAVTVLPENRLPFLLGGVAMPGIRRLGYVDTTDILWICKDGISKTAEMLPRMSVRSK